MIEFQFTVAGDKLIHTKISRIINDISDFTSSFTKLKDRFYRSEKKQFHSQGAWGSGGWQPLKEPYASWKRKKFPGRPILVRSGNLRRSLTVSGSFGNVERIKPTEMALGTSLKTKKGKPYPLFHQKQKTANRSFPIRQPIAFPNSEKIAFSKMIHDDLWRSIKND